MRAQMANINHMDKKQALELFGGSMTRAAKALGITRSAVHQWPNDLPDSARDRVEAYLWRQSQQKKRRAKPSDTPSSVGHLSSNSQ